MNAKQRYYIFAGVFFVWMILDVYSVTTLPIKELAITSTKWTYIAGIFILGYSLNKNTRLESRFIPLYSAMFLFASLHILLYAARRVYDDDYAITMILLNLLFLLAVIHIKIESNHILLFSRISLFVTLLLIVQWLFDGSPMSNFKGDIRNPNIMGVFASCLLCFLIIGFHIAKNRERYVYLLGIAAILFIIYVSSARAVLLLLAAVGGSAVILYFSKKAFSLLFYLVITFSAFFLLLTGKLANSPYFGVLNTWSKGVFGKGFLSGRQDIWSPALNFALRDPFFGHKVGIVPSEYIDDRFFKHVHNQFLQIFLETGLVGIVLFVLVLLFIWRIYQKGLNDIVVRWSACFFLGIIVYQTVEISLLGNKIEPISLLHWLIIGIGLNKVYHGQKNAF